TFWTSLEPAQVDMLSYNGPQEKFVLKRVGEGWQVAGKPELPINAMMVTQTLEALSRLRAERFVVDKGAKLKDYGLDPPQLVVEIQTRAGGKYTLQIGTRDKESRLYYAHVPQGDRSDVFVIAEVDAARITRSLAAFMRRSVDFSGERP